MIPRSDERPNTIALQWDGKYEEGRAQGVIYPGMALEVTIDQQNPAQLPIGVKANATVEGSPLRIAMECLLGNPDETKVQGMKISDAYAGPVGSPGDADYYSGDLVPYFIPHPGDVFQARVATTANFAIGDLLQPHTDGTFVAHAAGVARAMVAEDHDFTADEPAITPLLRVQAV